MAFPATTPTTQPGASALLSNNAANAGLTNATPFDRLTNLEQAVGNLLTDLPTAINLIAPQDTLTVITYATTMATNAALGRFFKITATDTVAMTISNPTNATTGKVITYLLYNSSGGTMGTITWGALFKIATVTKPATSTMRALSFIYDGTNWVEFSVCASDVPV